MAKAYVFDFDGTLVDSMPTWSKKVLSVLDKCGIKYPDNILEILTPLGDIGSARYFKEHFGVTMSDQEMFAIMDEYALPRYCDEIPLKEGVKEYLTLLKNSGAKLCVLTASPHKMLDPCLKRNGIYDIFDNVWSCDDFFLTKADIPLYGKVADALGERVADCVFFDDNIGAVTTAKKAGMTTVAVYDKSAETFTDKIKAVADYYIKSFTELNKPI